MNDRVMEFRIGVVVLAAVIGAVILIMLFGPQESIFSFQGHYTVQVIFPEAPGVREETPVLKSGVVIGRVTGVKLIDQDRAALVTLQIDSDRKIYSDEICRINRGLLGDTELEFVKEPRPRASGFQRVGALPGAPRTEGGAAWNEQGEAKPIPPGGPPLRGEVSHNPAEVVGNLEGELSRAISSVADTSTKLGNFIQRIDTLLGADEDVNVNRQRVRSVVDQSRETMRSIQQLADNANELVGDPQLRQRLRDSLSAVPELVEKTRIAVDSMNLAMSNLDSNLRNVQGFTQSLREGGQDMIAQLRDGASKLNAVMGEIQDFSRNLNSSQGSLGQLINDPQLYQNLNRTVANINQTMANVNELTRRLEPILNDARVFSDKIARHPEVLGVRGAIAPQSGAKGVPNFAFPP